MDRRHFMRSAGVVSVGSLLSTSALAESKAQVSTDRARRSTGDWFDPSQTWHFYDRWHCDHLDNLTLRQGTPEWQPDATFTDPPIGTLAGWPTVYFDEPTRRWRMLYSADWKPFGLMVAESDDGRSWRPLPQPDIVPDGDKLGPHHLFTLPGGSGGGVYHDPLAADGFPFKVFVHQQGDEVYKRALVDSRHRWHEVAKQAGSQRYINEEFTLVSRDGLHWEPRFDLAWSLPDWHPEPPIFGFFNRHTGRHSMVVRPGWGDRRQCLQTTTDFREWSGPELLLQPDALDEELIELYGMPVFPYGDGYVGLLWIFHCESSEPTRGFNRFTGPLDCQLAFSHDGIRFTRGFREPFISVNSPGEHGGGAIQPSCLVETDTGIRIYSAGSLVHHGRSRDARQRGVTDPGSILLHTLRKDGLMFLESTGDTGRLISKPLTLLEPELTVNATAPHGRILYQLTDMESRPVEGFTFDDCEPLAAADELEFSLQWRGRDLSDLVGRIVRLEMKLQHARLFAVRGHFHFIDAQDRSLLLDGQPLVSHQARSRN